MYVSQYLRLGKQTREISGYKKLSEFGLLTNCGKPKKYDIPIYRLSLEQVVCDKLAPRLLRTTDLCLENLSKPLNFLHHKIVSKHLSYLFFCKRPPPRCVPRCPLLSHRARCVPTTPWRLPQPVVLIGSVDIILN